ncbi:restriction endonuclease subunit S [Streptomyces sp. NPDC056454]|uniref:restriction endonuclease subunit S n=1 Tax=Streptomyces sp. NPDC056454 TaxID=3345823 RepID=UPI0036ACB819
MSLAWDVRVASGAETVPSGWQVRRIGDLVTLINGYPFPSDSFGPTGDVPLVRIRDLADRSFGSYVTGFVPPSVLLRNGDVVIGMDGDFNLVVWKRGEAALNQRLCLLRSREGVDMRFIAYALPSSLKIINDLTFATTVKHLSSTEILSERVMVPPLEEQSRIADFLDAETCRIDTLVAAKQRAHALIDERSVALTSHMCLRGANADVTQCDSGIGPLGPMPDHWKVTRNKNFLREVAELSQDGSEELLTVSHITGVTPRREKNVHMFQAESMAGYKICRPDDLVINTLWAWMGALGVTRHEGIVSPAYGVYRFAVPDVLPDYFDLLFRTPEYVAEMTRHSKGVWTSRLRLYPESFLALSSPVPPLMEQKEIVATVRREIGPGRKLQDAIQRSNALLTERRQALITAAVTGQFDVSTASGRNVTE